MVGLREAGVLGASLAVAGGAAYLIWSYVSSSGLRGPEEDGKSTKEEERREELREEERQEELKEEEEAEEAPQTVAPAEAQKTSSETPPQPVESEATQVLVLGLDGAGKTSLVHCFTIGSLEQEMTPTQGFNAVSINKDNLHIEFLEIGGKEDLRPYWQKYLSRALLLVFVVDSSDRQLFPVAKKHLHELLASRPRLPLMVLANKQDLPGSCSITDLHDALCLSEVGDRQLSLIGTYVKMGDAELSSGVQDAWHLIVHMVCGD